MATPSAADDRDEADVERGAADRPDVEQAFTLRQILGGFALLAALIVLLSRRRKRIRAGDE